MTASHGDPSEAVRNAVVPLLKNQRGADQNETRFFSPSLKVIADKYFSIEDNARDFDADWILGMQDWGGLTPSFSTFVLDESHALVTMTLSVNDAQPQIMRYDVVFDSSGGWKIDDISYNGGPPSLREMISHFYWCQSLRATNTSERGDCSQAK